MARPISGDYGSFYQTYIDLISDTEIVTILEESLTPLKIWLENLPQEKANFAYAPDKWTLGQVLQHMIDTERIFSLRALCFGRGEKQALPGFDENDYAREGTTSHKSLKTLSTELLCVRQATIFLFQDLKTLKTLDRSGIASSGHITVNALGYILAGHVLHHQNIVNQRYR